jgi:spermidine synthase
MDLTASPPRVRGAIVVAGAASLLAQVVLLREILASSHGNELVLGLVLAAWLGLTGVASAVGSRTAGSPVAAGRRLAVVLALAPLLLAASLWLVQLAAVDALGGEPSLLVLLGVSVLALLPACALGGLAFAWAGAAHGNVREGLGIYVAETAGAALAGLLFHFLLAEHLAAAWILWLAGAACAAAGVTIRWPRWSFVVLAGAGTLATLALCPTLDRVSVAARFPGVQVLAVQPSRYGLAAVVGRGEQRVFFHDGVLLFTTEDELAAEETVHLPMLLHPQPRRILMVDGGLGGGLAKVLEHGPKSVDYAEMDPALLDLARTYADPRTRAALADPRVHAMSADARALLRSTNGRYDLILLTLPVAQNALLARLSTREGLADARRALAPGGILALVTPGSGAHLDPAARQRHASLLATLTELFPAVGVAPDRQTILWASATAVDARADLLVDRLRERGLRPLAIGRAWLYDRLLPLHAQAYRRSLAGTAVVENRDYRPQVYLLGLIEHLERVSPRLGRALLSFAASAWGRWMLVGGVLAIAALALLVRRGRGAPGFAAAAAGAAGMALEMVLLLAFQSLVGHLYHALGGMLAGFMVGMAAGAMLARRWLGLGHALAWALVGAAVVAVSVIATLALARAVPAVGVFLVVGNVVVVGLVTGAVYPLAVRAAGHGRAIAQIYAWDLVGAAGAALLVSLLAVPLLGLYPVAALSAALCAAAAVVNRVGDS